MHWYLRWLKQEPEFRALIRDLPIITAIIITLTVIGLQVAIMFFPVAEVAANAARITEYEHQVGRIPFLFFAVLWTPIVEELTYRYIFFGLLFEITSDRDLRNRWWFVPATLGCIVLTSILFGYVHGVPNILSQGPGGIIFASVFVKYSGMGRSCLKGFAASTLCHMTINAVVFAYAIFTGEL